MKTIPETYLHSLGVGDLDFRHVRQNLGHGLSVCVAAIDNDLQLGRQFIDLFQGHVWIQRSIRLFFYLKKIEHINVIKKFDYDTL